MKRRKRKGHEEIGVHRDDERCGERQYVPPKQLKSIVGEWRGGARVAMKLKGELWSETIAAKRTEKDVSQFMRLLLPDDSAGGQRVVPSENAGDFPPAEADPCAAGEVPPTETDPGGRLLARGDRPGRCGSGSVRRDRPGH